MTEAHYLNAVVERGNSLQLITEEYSRDAVTDLLKRGPEAITLAPAGTLDSTRLLAKFKLLIALLTESSQSSQTLHPLGWRCYWWQPRTEGNLHFCGVLENERKVRQQLEELHQSLTNPIILLVSHHSRDPKRALTTNYDHLLESCLTEAIIHAPTAESASSEPRDREQLRKAREQLLARVPSFTSENLAAVGDSISGNASQYALDLRKIAKVFGVRFGRVWHYPKFQFDPKGRPFPEMRQVIEALAPDPKGWDRLQWFVTPHEALNGKTPLQVWRSDRRRVIEAASTERWHGRRD